MIVILHGALGSRHQFEPLLQRLGDRALMLEFPGHGSAPDVDVTWSIDLCVDALTSVLEVQGGKARIFGYSMGGYVAMTLALRRPDLIERIMTLGTKLHWTPEVASRESSRLDPDVIQQKVPQFAEDLARRHGEGRWRDVLASTADLMHGLGERPLLTPETVASLHTPVRLCLGDRDEMVTLDETVAIYRALPQAELAVLPGTRHPIEKVRVAELLHHIDTWLDPR
jgi:pimeloyl-ACP methyl ester carboxylesterase